VRDDRGLDEAVHAVRRAAPILVAAALVAGGSASARAQERVLVRVDGVAHDSLRARPLAGALISIAALGRSAITDSTGAFSLDSIPVGRHELVLQHEVLDSLGLPEARHVIDVSENTGRLRIATPSFAALWRAACGGTPPRDSGFVFGVARSARDRSGVAGAEVRASWVDVAFDQRRGVSQARMGGRVATGRDGQYAVCGVPNGVQLQLRAGTAPGATDAIEMFHEVPGVTRRDFLIPDADTSLRGAVRGVVRGSAGGPVPNALVNVPGAKEVRTDGEGRFMTTEAWLGTRVLVVRSIGAEPMLAVADVAWRDTAQVEILLRNIPVLDSVEVIGSVVVRRFVTELKERMELGIAKFVDSTRVTRVGNVRSAILSGSNARIARNGMITFGPNNCQPVFWIDRRYVRLGDASMELNLLSPEQIGAIEIYDKKTMIPMQYWPPNPDQKDVQCALVIWTKRNFP
jgi:hypothetical protein